MNRYQIIFGCLTVSMPAVVSASIISIGFESMPHGEILDNQFVDLGVDFGGTMIVFDSPIQSHTGVKEAFGPPFGSTPTRIHSVGADFDMFGAWFRGDGPGDVLTIRAFDVANNLLGTVSINTPPAGHTHGFLQIGQAETGGLPFSHVEITINAVGYSMDDMQFRLVPAPGAFALLGAGGLVAMKRRRNGPRGNRRRKISHEVD